MHSASGAEEGRFISFFDSKLAQMIDAIDVGANSAGQMMGVDEDVAQTGVAEEVEPIIEQWPAGDGNEAFGGLVGERTKTRSHARGHEEDFGALNG